MTIHGTTHLQASPPAVFLALGLPGSDFLDLKASRSRLAEPRLKIFEHLGDVSTSHIFFFAEYGNFSSDDQRSLSQFLGINRVEPRSADSVR